ncbi:MAG: YihY/virulence factor BrkB family protein, partial [Actinomycetota bacterium]|nr:YihY/virulence factor BrkB family protein [Actinomycetota bacterium]
FTALYAYMPNTKVAWRAAAIGGLTAGVLWQSASLGFASIVSGTTNYDAIYSSFAVVILLLIWLYIGWLILLVGCQLAFYIQHPAHMKPGRHLPLPAGRQTEYLALMIMGTTGRRFLEGKPPLAQEDIARELGAAPEHVALAVETLIARGFLTEAGRIRTQLVPARDLESVTLGELWCAIRAGNAEPHPRETLGREVIQFIDQAETGVSETHGRLSLRDWLKRPAGKTPAAEVER